MEVETADRRVEVEGPTNTPAVSILGWAAGATVSQEACLVLSDPSSHVLLTVSSWGFVLDPR